MAVSLHTLGSGRVEYRADRPIMHFATPPAVVQARIAEDRLRSRGFIMETITEPKEES